MYDFNNVLDLIRGGESAEAIAQAFADSLNNAIDVVEMEKVTVADYNEACETLANAWNDAVEAYAGLNGVNDEIVDSLMINEDHAQRVVYELVRFADIINTVSEAKTRAETKGEDFASVMSDFFKSIGI